MTALPSSTVSPAHVARSPVSKAALIAAIGLVFISLAAVTASRVSQLMTRPAPIAAAAPPLNAIALVFVDEPDGSIQVRNSDDRRLVQLIKPGTGGFVRGVMRGFARDRMVRDIGSAPPFLLALSQAGQLTMTDMATGRITVLEAFGSTNRASFASMLPPTDDAAQPPPSGRVS
jgi:putative photosynthetic complex assembly protein